MAITASDIHNQSFSIDRKGYDVDEVDVFLEHVADEIDILNDTIAHLQDQLEADRFSGFDAPAASTVAITEVAAATVDTSEYDAQLAQKDAIIADLERQLSDKRADDNAIAQALIIAQRSADEILAKANANATETIQDARDEAQRIIDRANTDRQDVIDAIRKLQDDREDAREEYADLLEGHHLRRFPQVGRHRRQRAGRRDGAGRRVRRGARPHRQLRDRRVRGAFRLRDASGPGRRCGRRHPGCLSLREATSRASATPTTSSSKRSTNQLRESIWYVRTALLGGSSYYLIFCLTRSPKEVSEVPTGAWNSLEKRLSVLWYAKESFECEGQVPVGTAAST